MLIKNHLFWFLMEDKVREICCYNCTLNNLNSEYASQFPLYLRGIATSKKKRVILPRFSEAGNDVVISDIDHILENGTELILNQEGKPTDRLNDFNDYGIFTRVAIYEGDPFSFEMMFVRNAFSQRGSGSRCRGGSAWPDPYSVGLSAGLISS